MRDAEHQEQSLLFQWAELARRQHEELELLFAIPNFAGFHGSHAARLRSGARSKAEGRKRGVPDICLPIARGGYHALYIELKAPGGKPSPEQKQWLIALSVAGNYAVLCVGWEKARSIIESYMALTPPLTGPP